MNAIDIREQNQALQLTVRKFTDEEQTTFDESQVGRYRPPQTRYGFVGRDLDILQIEKHLLSKRNILLVRGMGGAGKTTLLHRLGAWWQAIGFVDRVFYFGYDERAWTCQRIMSTIARRLLSADEYAERFESFSLKDQQTMLAERLRDLRHLLILDNLESITGANLAIQNTLPPREQAALRRFLADLVGGKTLVLLGSRSGEEWLMEEESTISEGRDRASPLQQDEVYELPGLDPEAASILADRILEQHQATQYRDHPDVQKLLTLLGGYPLPLEVVLADLACQTPVEVLKVLEASGVGVDSSDSEERTERILRCVEYSHGNLSSEAQGLLTCLAPFTSVIWQDILEPYTEKLREQPTLAHLPFDRWTEVLQEGARWGLLSSHPDTPSFLCLQPIFTYFLCNRLSGPEGAEVKQAVEVAFRQLYDELTHRVRHVIPSARSTVASPPNRAYTFMRTRLSSQILLVFTNPSNFLVSRSSSTW